MSIVKKDVDDNENDISEDNMNYSNSGSDDDFEDWYNDKINDNIFSDEED